jgi:hypothetical protein
LDQTAFAGLHSVTKSLQVLTAFHAKSLGAIPSHWLRGGRLKHRRLLQRRIVGLGNGRRSREQKDCGDERQTSDIVCHYDSSIAFTSPRCFTVIESAQGIETGGIQSRETAINLRAFDSED